MQNNYNGYNNYQNQFYPQNNVKNKGIKPIWAILGLILFWPVGLVLTWKTNWSKGAKIAITIVFICLAILGTILWSGILMVMNRMQADEQLLNQNSSILGEYTETESESSLIDKDTLQNNDSDSTSSTASESYETVSVSDLEYAMSNGVEYAVDTYSMMPISISGTVNYADPDSGCVNLNSSTGLIIMASLDPIDATQQQIDLVNNLEYNDTVFIDGIISYVDDGIYTILIQNIN